MAETTIPNLITSSDLRDRIGGPSSDPTEEGYISDAMLQSIIDEEEDRLNDLFQQRAESTDFSSIPNSLVRSYEVSVSTTTQDSPDLAQGSFPAGAYPKTKRAVVKTSSASDEGKTLAFDPTIEKTANRSSLFTRFRYYVSENTIYVFPTTVTAVQVWAPEKDSLLETLVGGEIAKANDRIVERARQMLSDRINEGRRLSQEGLYEQGIENDE